MINQAFVLLHSSVSVPKWLEFSLYFALTIIILSAFAVLIFSPYYLMKNASKVSTIKFILLLLALSFSIIIIIKLLILFS